MRKNKKKARLSSANSTGKVLNTSWKEYNDMARKVKNVENTAHKMDRGLELRVKDWGLSQCMGMENIPIEYVMSQSESVGMSDYQDSEIQTDDVIEIESTGSETNKEDDLGQIIINIDEVEETKYIYQSTLQTPLTRPLYFNLNKEEYSKLESEQSRFAYNIPAKRPRIHNNLHIYNQAIPYNKYKRANKRPERTFHSKRLSTIQPETKNYSSAKLSLSAKSDKSIALGQLYPECVDCGKIICKCPV